MNNEFEKNPLWSILTEVVHSLPIYKSHKSYVKNIILPKEQSITPKELSEKIGMPLGEAIVILSELKIENIEF